MLKFTEGNICTLGTDLLEKLDLSDNFVVSNMYYKPGTDQILCAVRRLAADGESFQTLDEYTVTVETGSDGGYFTIQGVLCEGWRGDFPQHIAKFVPGYELELVGE